MKSNNIRNNNAECVRVAWRVAVVKKWWISATVISALNMRISNEIKIYGKTVPLCFKIFTKNQLATKEKQTAHTASETPWNKVRRFR